MDIETIKNAVGGGGGSEHLDFAVKMAEELRTDLVKSFKKLAEQNGTTEENIQLALRFRNLKDEAGVETGEGEMFFQLMIGFKPEREANFNRDFLGIEGKAAMFPDETGKEAFIKIYVLGYPPLHIEGLFTTLAKKHNLTKWSDLSGIFYKKNIEDPIKLGIFIPVDGKNKRVETIDIFAMQEPIDAVIVDSKNITTE